MKNLKLLSLVFLFAISFSDLFAQEGNYSILVVKQTVTSKSMKVQNTYEIKHYVGNNMETDLTKNMLSVEVNNIVDVLNDLYKKGWKLVNVLTTGSLRSDDIDMSSFNNKTTVYYQYILSK
jgi:hypothetical protein